jgi:hypothetical protein
MHLVSWVNAGSLDWLKDLLIVPPAKAKKCCRLVSADTRERYIRHSITVGKPGGDYMTFGAQQI